jgi:lysozyme family protein
MTQADYTSFVERMIFRYEGNYGWDRGDSGGPTKFGVTCYDLAEHRHERMDSMARWAPIVRGMPLAEADDIYRTKYAVQCAFNDLNAGPDCVVFDFGVNSGSSRSVRYAQQIVGVGIDGELGPNTLRAINAMDAAEFVNRLCSARLAFLRSLRIWGRFGRGWNARVVDLRAYSLALTKPQARGRSPYSKKMTRIPNAHIKAHHPDDIHLLTGGGTHAAD